MALSWNIDSKRALVVATAQGNVTGAEFGAFLEALEDAHAMPYGKLFDATAGETSMGAEELLSIGVKLKGLQDKTLGPIAIVLPENKGQLIQRVLGILATANRPMRMFKTPMDAQRWLETFRPAQ